MDNATTPNDQEKTREGFPFELNGEKLFAPREKMRPPEILEIAWENEDSALRARQVSACFFQGRLRLQAGRLRQSRRGQQLYRSAHNPDDRRLGTVCHRPSIRSRSNFKNSASSLTVSPALKGEVVAFSYVIDVGRLAGTGCQLGFSMQEEGFPVYAPHWIHIGLQINDEQGRGRQYTDEQGTPWVAFSRPPTYWDNLPNKSMKTFLNEHVRRFLAHDV